MFELATPGAISAAATSKGICLAWSEMHSHQPVVYFAQFNRDGVRIGEPQRVFDVAADNPHIVIHNDEAIVQAADARQMQVAINSAGETAFAWIQAGDVFIRIGNKQQRVAEYVEAGFLALEPTGPSTWRVHFRRLPPRPSAAPSLGLTFADYNAKSDN